MLLSFCAHHLSFFVVFLVRIVRLLYSLLYWVSVSKTCDNTRTPLVPSLAIPLESAYPPTSAAHRRPRNGVDTAGFNVRVAVAYASPAAFRPRSGWARQFCLLYSGKISGPKKTIFVIVVAFFLSFILAYSTDNCGSKCARGRRSVCRRQARLMSQALRKLTAILSNTSCTLIFINQIRQKVNAPFAFHFIVLG